MNKCSYDDKGRIVKRDYDYGYTLYEYDERGNMTLQKYSDGDWTRFMYDDHNREIRMETFTGYWVNYEYDNEGKLSKTVDSNGFIGPLK